MFVNVFKGLVATHINLYKYFICISFSDMVSFFFLQEDRVTV